MSLLRHQVSFFVLVAGLAIFLPACTSGFERRWKAPTPALGTRDPFSGRWEGTWRSEKHRGAGGRLRCVFTRLDARRYDAHFKANWMLFASSYRTIFETDQRGGKLLLGGRHDLGALFGGVYTYRGEATPTRFEAGYDSSYDRGTFSMTRFPR